MVEMLNVIVLILNYSIIITIILWSLLAVLHSNYLKLHYTYYIKLSSKRSYAVDQVLFGYYSTSLSNQLDAIKLDSTFGSFIYVSVYYGVLWKMMNLFD